MTATTAYPKTSSAFPRLLLLAVLAIGVILCAHAVIQHGQDAQLVRQCAEDPNNLLSKWTDPNTNCVHNLIALPGHDREAGDMITTTNADGQEHEVTSLIPRGGNLEKIIEWLTNKKAVMIWSK